jgi:hypothetical protein
MTLQRSGHIVPPQQLRPSVSEAAQAIVLRGLAFDPTARLADARQFGDDLAQALVGAGEPTQASVTLATGVGSPVSASLPALPPPAGAVTPPVAGELKSAPVALPRVPLPPERRRGPLVAVLAALVLGVVLGLGYLATSWSSRGPSSALHQETTPEVSQAAPPPAKVQTLTYWLTLQRDPKRYPGEQPIQFAGNPFVSAGDRVRLGFRSLQGGHLYIFNEGPQPAGARRNVNVLFPSPTSNDGSAALDAGETVTIPGSGPGFMFDDERGVEKIWMVWSPGPQPRLEAMARRWANERDQGEIGDAADVVALDAFLQARTLPAPAETVDEKLKTTTLRAPADVFVKLVQLEHQ